MMKSETENVFSVSRKKLYNYDQYKDFIIFIKKTLRIKKVLFLIFHMNENCKKYTIYIYNLLLKSLTEGMQV